VDSTPIGSVKERAKELDQKFIEMNAPKTKPTVQTGAAKSVKDLANELNGKITPRK
jgi:glyceraldehyde-3-phosphate dehydrogenase/erythrose-4-phosphate dehydrogenase